MVAHTHTTVVEGCFRCELGQDEARDIRDTLITDIINQLYKTSDDKLYIIEAVLDL